MSRPNTVMKRCDKCGATSGDDWRQCEGVCAEPTSPFYDPFFARTVERIPHTRDDFRERSSGSVRLVML